MVPLMISVSEQNHTVNIRFFGPFFNIPAAFFQKKHTGKRRQMIPPDPGSFSALGEPFRISRGKQTDNGSYVGFAAPDAA